MSILSDINKTINDTDLYLWYNEQYIPFVLDHIEDVINLTSQVYGDVNMNWVSIYSAYITDDCLPPYIDKFCCIQWLLDNNKVSYDSHNDLYYTYDFLQDSSFLAVQFNYFYKRVVNIKAEKKSIQKFTPPESEFIPQPIDWFETEFKGQHRFVLKCDYSKELSCNVFPAVITL